MASDFSDLRQEYRHVALLEQDAHADPVEQFKDWFGQAVDYGVPLPNAMALATVAKEGKPTLQVRPVKGCQRPGIFLLHPLRQRERQANR